ncbi:MAG: 23S rRNA (uridine(2552)-2'-O)-methyltransferase [Methanomethylovorans sp.]|uniref:23S rRNA (uridine(2552)-2'-O)-methyltransferase n=1 Tax=Methanomethylovorans sp. TaxID=2758717 RepID=UPI000B0B48A9|nr:23S rRNA (uridine(2552)-2'-O)-methyltransferase [Methanomethylovorans sp.]
MARDRRDTYYWRAKEEGYRSRAAFKLLQINEKFSIIKEKDTVVDLGAAPGGWSKVAKELSGGRVIGVDLQRIAPIEGVDTIKGDITSDTTIKKIFELVGEEGVDTVICDAAPNLSGNWSYDHARSIDLSRSALECAKKILKPGGHFVVKVFQGDMFRGFLEEARSDFVQTKSFSPVASRSQSAEIYVISKRFIKAPVKKGEELDVEITSMGSTGDGVFNIQDFIVFVKGASKGDKVRIKVKDIKPNFAFADVISRY